MGPNDTDKFSDHAEALAFMATPFGGSDTTKWTSFFEKLSSLLPTVKINKNLLDHLQTDSHDLKDLGENFPKWLHNHRNQDKSQVRVMCFYEDLSTQSLGHIVSRESAQLTGYETASLDANHTGICKFDNFEDPKYKTVLNTLRKWVEEIKARNNEEDTEAVSSGLAHSSLKD